MKARLGKQVPVEQCGQPSRLSSNLRKAGITPDTCKPGDLSISLRGLERNKHFKVQTTGDQLRIGSRAFPSMTSLIQHYTANPIFASGSEKLYLTRPLAK
ncbi:unnamed protein product [Haemonchus placei]|uniref:SH2 domain-containing protein n=1 Tax=Haemonchus placei TaxID=6290 RepID=A0A0N4X7U7_HAEPC|nr:unnamed protein product [Haemonchus placei]